MGWLAFAPWGLLAVVPALLAVAAIIDALRTGAHPAWIAVALALPVVGPLAYFLFERAPGGSQGLLALLGEDPQTRTARRQLRGLEVQVGHWRGPALLGEMAECQLTLQRHAEAEALLREAMAANPGDRDLRYLLARALDAQGKAEEATGLYQRLVAESPDLDVGQAALALSRLLDEGGRRGEAEAVLRGLLERHGFPEARARLGRLLLARGERDEAQRLLADLARDAEAMPRFARRKELPWIRAAARLARGGQAFPTSRGLARSARLRHRLLVGTLGLCGLLLVVAVIGYALSAIRTRNYLEAYEQQRRSSQELRQSFIELDLRHPSRVRPGEPLAAGDVDRYLEMRRALDPLVAEARAEAERPAPAFAAGLGRAASVADWRRLAEDRHQRTMSRSRRALDLLDRGRMGPGELLALAALVEWRYLGRREALPLAVPEHLRADFARDRHTLDSLARMPPGAAVDAPEWVAEVGRARRRVGEIEARAERERGLDPATRATLDARRADLESLDPGQLAWLPGLLDPDGTGFEADDE